MRRAVHVREGGSRALLVLALLLAGSLLGALAGPAAAQATPELCFQQDADGDAETEGIVFRCAAEMPNGPNYLQGDFIDIRVERSPVGAYVRVRCLTDCHETEGKSYYTQYAAGSTVRFPRDFKDPMGANAVADRAPRYNSSWEAVVLVGSTPVARGVFNVWLMDVFAAPEKVVMPGARHGIRAAGFDPGANVQLAIQRRTAEGEWVGLPTPTGSLVLFTAGGFSNHVYLPSTWVVPLEQAQNITRCADRSDCFRLVVKGAGKADESVPFRVEPALMRVDRSNSAGNVVQGEVGSARAARTTEILVAADLHYPGGRSTFGEALLPKHVPESPITGERTLRVRVERVNVTGTHPVQDVPLRYSALAARWEGTWTIPKDFPTLAVEPDATYRLRLLPDQDLWGNRLPALVLAEHRVEAARLAPTILSGISSAPRTEEVNFTYHVLYLNGTPVTPDDLKQPLRGCFVRVSQGDTLNCGAAGVTVTTGEYVNGTWVFKARFPRDYPHLEDHRFNLSAGVEDRWGNVVAGATTPAFRVVPGEPHVSFSTVVRGRDATILERGGGAGSHVSVQAVITYGDGTPFNRYVNQNESSTLPGTLVIRRGPNEPIASQRSFDLREADANAGRWMADLLLTSDDVETPLGTWTFSFDVRDNLSVPNKASVSFHREVRGVPLLIDPVRQPFPLVETEATQQFRFRVLYHDGTEVPRGDLLDRMHASVFRYNPANHSAYGAPVSSRLIPMYHADSGWYQVEFKVPNNLFSGTYAFVVSGGDRHGNLLAQDAYSREFSTTSRTLERGVVTQPAPEVIRGESATVVFDAREGDVGLFATGGPHLRVERFDASLQQWVVERSDVRQTAPDLLDHVGLFPITLTTPVGLYRFTLEGRDANLQRIVATSQNFSVQPTDVARALFTPPPERVVKGSAFFFTLERQEGDRYTDARVLHNGRAEVRVNGQAFQMPMPILAPSGTFLNVTWEVPYEAPSGNYTLRLLGRDLYGNRLEALTPAIEAQSAQLTGRILGNPGRSIARGETANLLFGVTYPEDRFYLSPDPPTVQVMRGAEVVAFASVRAEARTYVASWTPPDDADAADYHFEVTGTGTGGNAFPALRSSSFRVFPGTVERDPAVDVARTLERMTTASFAVPMDTRDREVEFFLAYYGPGGDATSALFDTREPDSRALLAHAIEPATGRYVARFITDQQTPPGIYRILMRGEDGHGNELAAKSSVFILTATSIQIVPDPAPADDAFQEGKPLTLSFVARYRSGVVMDETLGRPSAVVLYTAPGRAPLPVTVRPDVEYRDGRWYATWTPPQDLPEGLYEFSFGGADNAGNAIGASKSRSFVVTSSIAGSAAKLIPGLDSGALLLGVAVVALALARRRAP